MNQWNEKEVNIMADLTTNKNILYRDVYLLTDQNTKTLQEKTIYFLFDKEIPVFPIYQDRHFIQSRNWRPISREVITQCLKPFQIYKIIIIGNIL